MMPIMTSLLVMKHASRKYSITFCRYYIQAGSKPQSGHEAFDDGKIIQLCEGISVFLFWEEPFRRLFEHLFPPETPTDHGPNIPSSNPHMYR
jgi:hypothetical protein